ncbi:MAG: hypothetical protein LBR62_00655, partial [Puniceicoccales bacterium]|nr:hypothetical protein [Puniceicoccales bacterium]
ESQNSAKLLARPSVITMDNMEAVMSRNETYYQSVSGSNKETGNDLFPITSGTTLKVTPHIVGCSDGRPQIQLLLDVKDGSVTPTNEAKKTLSNVNDSTIVTQAVVFEGQSVLVGGYFRETHSFGESGIPFIKELPVLGNAFKTKVKNKSVVERLFLITPTIVRLSASDTDAHGDYFRTVEEGHSVLDNVHENRPGGRSP